MRVPLPGGSAELADTRLLNLDHQDDYQDLLDKVRGEKEKAALAAAAAAYPGTVPDPDAEPPAVRLGRKDLRPLHDLVCTWVVQDISFAGVLPWDAGAQKRLIAAGGLGAWNALLAALSPYFVLLTGGVPKETPTSDLTSSATSEASAAALPAA